MLQWMSLVLVAIFLTAAPQGYGLEAPANNSLASFLKAPSRSQAKAALKQGAKASEIEKELQTQTDKTTRLLLTKMLVVSAAKDKTAKSSVDALFASAGASNEEKFITLFLPLLEDPSDTKAQDKFIEFSTEHRLWLEFDYAFFGEAGLSVATALISRFDTLEHPIPAVLTAVLVKNFPIDANDLIVEKLSSMAEGLAKLPRDEASNLADSIGAIVSELSSLEAQDKVLLSLIDEPSEVTMDDVGKFRGDILQLALPKLKGAPSDALVDAFEKFYVNDETKPIDNESIDRFGDRRRHLLIFMSILRSLQEQGGRLKITAELIVGSNGAFLATSEISEVVANLKTFAGRMESPAGMINSLLSASKEKPIIQGMQLIRAVPSGYWNSESPAKTAIRARVLSLSQYGVPTIPEDVRLEASLTRRYLEQNHSENLDVILSGLSSASTSTRLRTLELISEADIDSADIAETIVRVLNKDPDVSVKTRALEIIEVKIRRDNERGITNSYLQSRSLGLAIFLSFKNTDADLLAAAKECLNGYLVTSLHSEDLVREALKSNVPAIKERGIHHANEMLTNQINKLTNALNALNERSPDSENLNEVLGRFENTMHFMIALVSREYTQDSKEQRASRLYDLTRPLNGVVTELRKISKDTSEENKEAKAIADKALEQISKALAK